MHHFFSLSLALSCSDVRSRSDAVSTLQICIKEKDAEIKLLREAVKAGEEHAKAAEVQLEHTQQTFSTEARRVQYESQMLAKLCAFEASSVCVNAVAKMAGFPAPANDAPLTLLSTFVRMEADDEGFVMSFFRSFFLCFLCCKQIDCFAS